MNALVTFRLKSGNSVIAQVGVLPSLIMRGVYVPYDNTGGNRTGIAVTQHSDVPIRFAHFREDGTLVEARNLGLTARQKVSFFFDEQFSSSANSRGSFVLSGPAGRVAAFTAVALNLNGSSLSTASAMPIVIERSMTMQEATGSSQWLLRLVQLEEQILYGVAQRISPNPTLFRASGAVFDNPGGTNFLQLTIHALSGTANALSFVLVGSNFTDLRLSSGAGKVLFVRDDGTVVGNGDFTLRTPTGAQYKGE